MYPVEAVKRPAILSGQTNGKLDPSLLVETDGLDDGPLVRLVEPAARAWRALCAAALAAGHTLKATSLTDSYRPYAVQERIFRERYTTDYLAGRPTRTWLGQTWYQKPGTAQAAVPGTSNHGWGLAVDTGEERDGDSGTESLDAATLAWLIKHAAEYGWSWEVQSEPWHIRYWAGENIPAAVMAYEGDDMLTEKEQNDWQHFIWRVQAITEMQETIQGGPQKGREVPIVIAINKLAARLDALELGGVDVNALAGAVAAAVGKREAAADRARADELD